LHWYLVNRFSDDEAGKMTLEQQVLLLTRMVRLIEEMSTTADYIGKDKVVSHLRWATEHVSNDIWARTIHKDYKYEATNGDA
jgi:hypothetical protein